MDGRECQTEKSTPWGELVQNESKFKSMSRKVQLLAASSYVA